MCSQFVFNSNIMGDKLITNFAAKFQPCHGNISCISISVKMVLTFLTTVTLEKVMALKEAAEKLNARKSTIPG